MKLQANNYTWKSIASKDMEWQLEKKGTMQSTKEKHKGRIKNLSEQQGKNSKRDIQNLSAIV